MHFQTQTGTVLIRKQCNRVKMQSCTSKAAKMMKLDFSHLTLQHKSLLGAFDILKSIWSKPTISWCDISRDKRHSFAVPLVHQAGVVLNPTVQGF